MVNVNPVPKGLMLTLCALGEIKPSTQGVNVNPLHTGLNQTQYPKVNVNPLRTGLD